MSSLQEQFLSAKLNYVESCCDIFKRATTTPEDYATCILAAIPVITTEEDIAKTLKSGSDYDISGPILPPVSERKEIIDAILSITEKTQMKPAANQNKSEIEGTLREVYYAAKLGYMNECCELFDTVRNISDEDFDALLKAAIPAIISPKELAQTLDISERAIIRCIEGTNPQPSYNRVHIARTLGDLTKDRIEASQARLLRLG